MKSLLASVSVAAALAVPALASGQADPVSAVKADLAKLRTDVTATSATIVADAQKLTADATAAKGGTKAQAKASVKPDVTKLHADLSAAKTLLEADKAQLKVDVAAAKQVKGAKKALKADLKSTRDAVHQARSA